MLSMARDREDGRAGGAEKMHVFTRPAPRRSGAVRRRAAVVMWTGISGSVLLLVVLLARGWGRDAWALAAGVLLMICLGVCVTAAILGERAARSIDDAVAQLAEDRRRQGSST